ncbi:hypothetical protein [Brevundimonas sp. SGAir0440]|uniref:hypothetical protein n=1 Tax=Brevundimonas sp. SGAir0440 TaxID=2579977 RepID=UPI0010CCDDE5|nr:hypothetical protein [Brevundimonas sp. SGAir0440]QCQ98519.1 hypothetical protein E7T10_07485 [Brevundimonas sp. SGAir0440]
MPFTFICAVDYPDFCEFFNFLSGKARFRSVRAGSYGQWTAETVATGRLGPAFDAADLILVAELESQKDAALFRTFYDSVVLVGDEDAIEADRRNSSGEARMI